MAPPPAQVMVDDTDSSIIYSGSWSLQKGTLDNALGSYGDPYMSTVHGTTSQASFTYHFSGSSMTVAGSVQVARNQVSGNTSWKCTVDGSDITVDNPIVVSNRNSFCHADSLSDGAHTLVVQATGTSTQTFWFDHLQYIPSPGASLSNDAVLYNAQDPQIKYGNSWGFSQVGFQTNQETAVLHFPFNGVSLLWYGFYSDTFPSGATSATYSIDGQSPVSFPLRGGASRYLQVFFTVNGLSDAPHTLEVVYRGNSNSVPLTVQGIVVQRGTSTAALPLVGSPVQSSSGGSTPGGGGGGIVAAGSSTVGTDTTGSIIPGIPATVSSNNTSLPTTGSLPTSSTKTAFSTPGASGSLTVPVDTRPSGLSESPSAAASRATNVGVIVGPTVAGVVVLFGLLLAVLFMLGKRLHRSEVDSRPRQSRFWLSPFRLVNKESDVHRPGTEENMPAKFRLNMARQNRDAQGADGMGDNGTSIQPPPYTMM